MMSEELLFRAGATTGKVPSLTRQRSGVRQSSAALDVHRGSQKRQKTAAVQDLAEQ